MNLSWKCVGGIGKYLEEEMGSRYDDILLYTYKISKII